MGVAAWAGMNLPSSAAPLGTAFTYQGVLVDDGAAVSDTCDFQFSLWDSEVAGSAVGGTVAQSIAVEDGLFTTGLDFGVGIFNGQARWLRIAVCCPSPCSPALVPLDPRQELTPAPHALALPGLYTQQNTGTPNLIGGYIGNIVDPGVVGATIGGGGDFSSENQVSGAYGTVSGGLHNEAGPVGTVAGGQVNEALGIDSTVGGGANNIARGGSATVPGGAANRAGGDYSFAAGKYARVRDTLTVGDFDGDEGTFIWADATHTSGNTFTSTGANQFLISAAGGVGLGTNAPTDPLTVNGVIRSMTGGFELPDGTIISTAASIATSHYHSTLAASDGSPSNAVFVDAIGRVGVGTTSPDTGYQMDVSGSLAGSGIRVFAAGSSSFAVNASNSGSGGTGIIGSALFSTGVNYGVRGLSSSTSGFDFFAMGSGTDYGSSSSIRWKRNIRTIDSPLEKVARLRGCYFDWNAERGGHHDVGFIAEEVGAVLPEIVAYEENGVDAIGLDYSRLTPLLVEAVKAQSQQIADQQRLIEDLAGRLERLEGALGAVAVKEVK